MTTKRKKDKRVMVPFRMDAGVKEFFQGLADKERRSLNNFLFNAALTYVKDHYGVDWPPAGEDERGGEG